MSTAAAITEAQRVSSTVAWLYLVTIRVQGQPPLRLVNNAEPVVSRGETFEPYPFKLRLSPDDGERVPTVRLNLLHINGAIAHALRAIDAQHVVTPAPTVSVELVLSSQPDLVERSLEHLRLVAVNYDAFEADAQLEMWNTLGSGFPAQRYGANEFPGLFV